MAIRSPNFNVAVNLVGTAPFLFAINLESACANNAVSASAGIFQTRSSTPVMIMTWLLIDLRGIVSPLLFVTTLLC